MALISIDASATQGAIPGIWRPSVMYGHSTSAMIDLFEGISGGWGLVRLVSPFGPADWMSASSQGDFITKFTAYLSQSEVTTALARGTCVLLIDGPPVYLSSATALYGTAKVPSDLSHGGSWELFCKLLCDTAQSVLGVLYRAPRNGGGAIEIGQPGLIFEVGNEWGGETAPQLANAKTTYLRLWQGVKASDSNAAVLLPGPVVYNRLEAGGKTTIREFCEYAGANGCPPDLVGWHSFQGPAALADLPAEKVSAAQVQVTSDLAAGGLSASTPRILTEFQSSFLGTDLGTDGHNSRNNYHSAAYFASSLWEHWQSGVSGMCMAALLKQNSTPPPSSAPFNETGLGTFAGWGMVTNTTVPVPTAQFSLSKLFALWDGGLSLGGGQLPGGIRYFAAVNGADVIVLLARWDPIGVSSVPVDLSPVFGESLLVSAQVYHFDSTHNSAMANFAAAVGTDTQRQQAAQDAAVSPTATTVSASVHPTRVTLSFIDTAVVRFTFMARNLQIGECTNDAGPLPPTMRPAVFQHSFGGVLQEYEDFLAMPNISMIRDSLDFYMGTDHYDALAQIQNLFDTNSSRIVQPLRSGIRVLISNWVNVPVWAQRCTKLDAGIVNAYPASLDQLHEFWYKVGRLFIDNGVDPNLCYWTIGNEPETGPVGAAGGFSGTPEDLAVYYLHYAHALKSADPRFRVGGMEFGNALSTVQEMTSPGISHAHVTSGVTSTFVQAQSQTGITANTVETWIRYVAYPPRWVYGGRRGALDFISTHLFIDIPNHTTAHVLQQWLRKYGYDPANVEHIISESNFGLGSFPVRAGEIGASQMAMRCHLFEESTVDLWTYALIREGFVNDDANGYDGQTGLFHRVNGGTHNLEWIACTHRHVMTMLSKLGKRRIHYSLSTDAYDAGFRAECTAEGSTRWILLTRDSNRNGLYPFGADNYADRFAFEMWRRFGLDAQRNPLSARHAYYTGMDAFNTLDYVVNTFTPRADLPAEILAQLAEVKAHIVALRAVWNGNVTISVQVDDPSKVATLAIYQLDSIGNIAAATNNPRAAYLARRAAGGTYNQQVGDAIAAGTFTATFSGTGADLPKTMTFGPFSVALLKIESSATPNPNTGGWTSKPVAPWSPNGPDVLVQLNANYNTQDSQINPVWADGSLVTEAAVIYDPDVPIHRVVEAIQRIKDRVANRGSTMQPAGSL